MLDKENGETAERTLAGSRYARPSLLLLLSRGFLRFVFVLEGRFHDEP